MHEELASMGNSPISEDVLSLIRQKLPTMGKSLMKSKVYVKGPEDVPEGYSAMRGPQGGMYYETEAVEHSKFEFGPTKESRQALMDYGRERNTMSEFLSGVQNAEEVKQRIEKYAEFMDGKTYSLISKVVEDQSRELLKAGVSKETVDALAADSTDKLVYQEMRSWERQLGDHGIRHIEGNIRIFNEILNSFKNEECAGQPCPITDKDRLIGYIVMVNHDIGYTAEPSRTNIPGTKYHKEFSEKWFENERVLYEKVLGKDDFERAKKYILLHDTPDIDWEKDPVLAAISVADNLALFHREKLPTLFKKVPDAIPILIKMQQALNEKDTAKFAEYKGALDQNIDKTNLPEYTKYLLKKAAKEISPYTPPVTLSMLAGSVGSVSYHKGDGLDVEIIKDPFESDINKLYDQGQSKFVKLAESYGIRDFEKDKFDFIKNGKKVLSVHAKNPSVEKGEMIFKSDEFTVFDNPNREFEGWASVSIIDKQGDFIGAGEVAKMMPIYVKRGAPVMDTHSNRPVGQITKWELKKKPDGADGIYVWGNVFKDYSTDDFVWDGIKNGRYTGLSLGGRNLISNMKCDTHRCFNNIEKLEVWEFSLVPSPANKAATLTSFNKLAKNDEFADEIEKNGRPPKAWWDNCVSRAKHFTDDPSRYCGWLYFHGDETGHGKQKESFGKPFTKGSEIVEKSSSIKEEYEKLTSMSLTAVQGVWRRLAIAPIGDRPKEKDSIIEDIMGYLFGDDWARPENLEKATFPKVMEGDGKHCAECGSEVETPGNTLCDRCNADYERLSDEAAKVQKSMMKSDIVSILEKCPKCKSEIEEKMKGGISKEDAAMPIIMKLFENIVKGKWDGSTDSGSEYHDLRSNHGLSHDSAVAYIEGRKSWKEIQDEMNETSRGVREEKERAMKKEDPEYEREMRDAANMTIRDPEPTEGEKQDMFEYLDDLRDSGATNMFGAGSHLQREFGIGSGLARKILLEWMQTYGERHKGDVGKSESMTKNEILSLMDKAELISSQVNGPRGAAMGDKFKSEVNMSEKDNKDTKEVKKDDTVPVTPATPSAADPIAEIKQMLGEILARLSALEGAGQAPAGGVPGGGEPEIKMAADTAVDEKAKLDANATEKAEAPKTVPVQIDQGKQEEKSVGPDKVSGETGAGNTGSDVAKFNADFAKQVAEAFQPMMAEMLQKAGIKTVVTGKPTDLAKAGIRQPNVASDAPAPNWRDIVKQDWKTIETINKTGKV